MPKSKLDQIYIAQLEAEVAKLKALLSIAGASPPPPSWDGGVQIKGCVEEQTPDGRIVLWSHEARREPEFWGVYYRVSDGTHTHFHDFPTYQQAVAAALNLEQLYRSEQWKEK